MELVPFPGSPDAPPLSCKLLDPILSGPRDVIRGEQGDDSLLVTPYGLQHPGRRFPVRVEDQVGARDAEVDAVLTRQADGLDRAHTRAFQRGRSVSADVDCCGVAEGIGGIGGIGVFGPVSAPVSLLFVEPVPSA